MAWASALLAFIKALPDIFKLIDKLTNAAMTQSEIAAIKKENEMLKKAMTNMQNNHDNTNLNDLFNGKK